MTRRLGGIVIVTALLASGCINTNFDPPYLVKGPRILDIRAQPPEVAFGQDVVFESLLVDGDGSDLSTAPGVELRYTVCLSAKAVLDATGLGFASNLTDNCAEGGSDSVHLETGGDLPPGGARLPGSAFSQLLTGLMAAGGAVGDAGVGSSLASTLLEVVGQVGVPLEVHLEVRRDGAPILTGFKRFAITQRPNPTTNPPPPRFSVDGAWLNARNGSDPHDCAPEGAMPSVQAGADITLHPDEHEDAWIESYPVFNLDGQIQTNHESAYYSWYSTGGKFSEAITQRPMRDVTWTAPDMPDTYPILGRRPRRTPRHQLLQGRGRGRRRALREHTRPGRAGRSQP